jgi:hypothetical protein
VAPMKLNITVIRFILIYSFPVLQPGGGRLVY